MRSARSAGSVTEALEPRRLFSSTAADPIVTPPIAGLAPVSISSTPVATPNTTNASAPYTPSLVRSAYGIGSISFNGVSGTGAGQTIAIIDAYNDPNILADANYFSSYFSLPSFNGSGGPTLTVQSETGTSSLPANSTSSNGGWDVEEALDVEWAHAVAPSANLELYEANSASLSDLMTAVTTAAGAPGVSVVSMSFGTSEFSSETSYDGTFLTPAGHQNVTFLASTGDDKAPAEYPAYSPNVVAVGGTSLTVTTGGSYVGETAWGDTSDSSGGGGGVSSYESQPSYQAGHVNNLGGTSSPKRTAPDVSFLADPNTGVYVYDTWNQGHNNGGFYLVGGTSLACPMWAGLISIADQGRASEGLGTLNGETQVLPTLYTLSSSDYHDITAGNNGYAAGTGYDLATGIGTPIANLLVPALANLGNTPGVGTHLAFSAEPPASSTAGATFNVSVQVLDANGNLATADNGTVTLTLTGNAAALDGNTIATVQSGVATFTGLWMTQAGSGYTLTGSESGMTAAASNAITITPAAASQLAFTQQPTASTVNAPQPGMVTVAVEDTYGNVVTSDNSTVTLSLSSNAFRSGATSTSLVCTAGSAVFSAIAVDAVGSYTLTAADASLSGATSNSFNIARATPNLSGTVAAGTYNATAQGLSTASVVDTYTGAVLGTYSGGSITVAYYAGALTPAQAASATALGSTPVHAGTYTAKISYGGSANYNATATVIPYTITPRTLTVTASAANRAYDGAAAAAVTLFDNPLSGDTLTVSDTSATFASAAAGTGRTVTINGLSLSGSSAPDYTLGAASITTTANITPLNVTGSIAAASKTYDDTTTATLASATLTGLLAGDAVTLTGAANFDSAQIGVNRVVTANLSLTGAAAGDYTLTNPVEFSTATITPRSVSAVITAASKTYDGTTTAALGSETLTNAIANDAVSLQINGNATFNSKDVNTASTMTVTGLSLAGADAADYTLTNTTATAAAHITPLTVTGSVAVASKTYDGTTTATITTRSLSTVLPGDSVALSGGVATFKDDKVANNKPVTITQLTLTGPQAADYTLTDPSETAVASITPMSISGNVFNDANLDATDDTGDLALSGRTVYLETPGHGTKGAKSTKTDANGNFSFTNIAAGTYVIALAGKSGWLTTTAAADTVTLAAGGTTTGVRFGSSNASSVSGEVFTDANQNGKIDSGDTGIAGLTITLVGTGHTAGVTLTATTSADGAFAFAVIPAGTYKVNITLPTGQTLSPKSAKATALNLGSAKLLTNVDFGETPIATAASRKIAAHHALAKRRAA